MSFLLFAGHHYYPLGGFDDLVARGEIEYLKQYFVDHALEIANRGSGYIDIWGQIVDASTLNVVLVSGIKGRNLPAWSHPPTIDGGDA